jgi:hypothetical protein
MESSTEDKWVWSLTPRYLLEIRSSPIRSSESLGYTKLRSCYCTFVILNWAAQKTAA